MARQILLKVDLDLCHACRRCLAAQACKMRAIVKVDADEPPFLDDSRCRDCQVCVPACPFHAIVKSR